MNHNFNLSILRETSFCRPTVSRRSQNFKTSQNSKPPWMEVQNKIHNTCNTCIYDHISTDQKKTANDDQIILLITLCHLTEAMYVLFNKTYSLFKWFHSAMPCCHSRHQRHSCSDAGSSMGFASLSRYTSSEPPSSRGSSSASVPPNCDFNVNGFLLHPQTIL